jgi:hypothetical protein
MVIQMKSLAASSTRGTSAIAPTSGAAKARRKLLRYFPGAFGDPKYLECERDYKWAAHKQWREQLPPARFRRLLDHGRFSALAGEAVAIAARTNLLFTFERIALRDAVKSISGATTFAFGLHEFLHGGGTDKRRFERWRETVVTLPQLQSRVLTWPILTLFGFLAQPRKHVFLKPRATTRAALAYEYDLKYSAKPDWETYRSCLGFAECIRRDNRDLAPRDMIDLQSFIWVLGSDEYPD